MGDGIRRGEKLAEPGRQSSNGSTQKLVQLLQAGEFPGLITAGYFSRSREHLHSDGVNGAGTQFMLLSAAQDLPAQRQPAPDD